VSVGSGAVAAGADGGADGVAGARCSTGAGASRGGTLPQPSSAPRIVAPANSRPAWIMWLLILEALAALALLVGIVWWTMFSGRSKGELGSGPEGDDPPRRPD
jgi:hypothetical protein